MTHFIHINRYFTLNPPKRTPSTPQKTLALSFALFKMSWNSHKTQNTTSQIYLSYTELEVIVKKQGKIRKPQTKPTKKPQNHTRISKKHLFHFTFLVAKPPKVLTNNLVVNSVSIKLSFSRKTLEKIAISTAKGHIPPSISKPITNQRLPLIYITESCYHRDKRFPPPVSVGTMRAAALVSFSGTGCWGCRIPPLSRWIKEAGPGPRPDATVGAGDPGTPLPAEPAVAGVIGRHLAGLVGTAPRSPCRFSPRISGDGNLQQCINKNKPPPLNSSEISSSQRPSKSAPSEIEALRLRRKVFIH